MVQVTATQGGVTYNGLLLRVYVLTGAQAVAAQTGGSATNNDISGTITVTGTVQQTSSRIYGAADLSAVSGTESGSGATLVDDQHDTTNTMAYITFKQAAPATGSQAYGAATTANAGWGCCWLEVLAATALAEDASAPAPAWTDAAITVTAGPFTPPAGSLLVALVASDGGAGVTTMTVTDDLGVHYNWAEKVKCNTSGYDYAGVWIADVPASTTAAPDAPRGQAAGTAPAAVPEAGVTAGHAQATGTAPGVSIEAGLATAALYAGTATGITGSWAGTGNATGPTTGTYATWSDTGPSSSATLELASFAAQAAVPAGATISSIACTVRHAEDHPSVTSSVTAQAYPAGSPSGSPQALAVSATVHDDTVTFTGLTWADLSDLRVRLTVTRTA